MVDSTIEDMGSPTAETLPRAIGNLYQFVSNVKCGECAPGQYLIRGPPFNLFMFDFLVYTIVSPAGGYSNNQ